MNTSATLHVVATPTLTVTGPPVIRDGVSHTSSRTFTRGAILPLWVDEDQLDHLVAMRLVRRLHIAEEN
ncbi:hypothetical protein [Luteococcus japonicus]|uniref:Uncharacterized protein n=1 Tax=Luteococcus japonicus LSP_Lj1 TaxID=1255658 RepID=A0A1R4K4Y2_9ACTN|nr:hypothetical protein [Luteococcus japonicus]SJN39377.1 hypothetical protein FM114_11500 [Luteococcus japonicus LSP_Lj1]